MNNLNLHDNNVPSKVTFNPTGYTNTLSDKTKLVYISTILEFFNVESLNDITIDMMQTVDPDRANSWAVSMLEKGLKKSTINKKMSAMKNFYKFLCRRTVGVMSYNPFDTDEGAIRYKHTSPDFSPCRTLSPTEIQNMIAVASSKKGLEGLRNKIIMSILCTTGMRREEIAGLKIGYIKKQYVNQNPTHIFEFYGKGNKLRRGVISEDIYIDILNYVEKRNLTMKDKDQPMFISHAWNADKTKPINDCTIYRIVKSAAEGAGLNPDDVHPHTLRHTFATVSYKNGMGVKALKDVMGHSSMNTTNRYIHANDTLEKAAEAAEKIMNMINDEKAV